MPMDREKGSRLCFSDNESVEAAPVQPNKRKPSKATVDMPEEVTTRMGADAPTVSECHSLEKADCNAGFLTKGIQILNLSNSRGLEYEIAIAMTTVDQVNFDRRQKLQNSLFNKRGQFAENSPSSPSLKILNTRVQNLLLFTALQLLPPIRPL